MPIQSLLKEILRPVVRPVRVRGLARLLRRRAARCSTIEELVALAMRGDYLGFGIAPMQLEDELTRFMHLVREARPKRVLEIGTARGGSLFLLCQVCPEDTLIVSVDLPDGMFGGGYPAWKVPLYRGFARGRQKLHLIRGDSHLPATFEQVRTALGGEELDLLFIDGDHSYEGVSRDFADYTPLVRAGGLVALHDVVPGPAENVGGAPLFWGEIAGSVNGRVFQSATSAGCYGIGVIEDWRPDALTEGVGARP